MAVRRTTKLDRPRIRTRVDALFSAAVNIEIIQVLVILGAALVLFITEWIRMDLVALLVLVALAVLNLVSPSEALSGFSNAAVVTVWAMFILSEGLTRTGIANILGQQVLRFAGRREIPLIVVIMLVGGFLSAFMNNIGVAALMLPVIIDIARRTETPPSILLMPMAYATLLGGLTTQVGTPPNLLISGALAQRAKRRFRCSIIPASVSALSSSALPSLR
jgi:di/tricarboxylate transporter